MLESMHTYESMWEVFKSLADTDVLLWKMEVYKMHTSDRPVHQVDPGRVEVERLLACDAAVYIDLDPPKSSRARATDNRERALDQLDCESECSDGSNSGADGGLGGTGLRGGGPQFGNEEAEDDNDMIDAALHQLDQLKKRQDDQSSESHRGAGSSVSMSGTSTPLIGDGGCPDGCGHGPGGVDQLPPTPTDDTAPPDAARAGDEPLVSLKRGGVVNRFGYTCDSTPGVPVSSPHIRPPINHGTCSKVGL